MIYLHTYSNVRIPEQLQTKRMIGQARQSGRVIDSVLCTEPTDYHDALLDRWGYDDLVNIEQDIVASPEQWESLEQCSELACAYPYPLHGYHALFTMYYDDPTTKIGQVPYSTLHARIPRDTDTIDIDPPIREWKHTIPPLPQYSAGAGIGFAKISRQLQSQLPLRAYPVAKYQWWYLDTWMSWYMSTKLGVLWHVHMPEVEHNHAP